MRPTAKIMLVDDDPAFLEIYTELLAGHFHVDAAHAPAEALQLLADSGPYAVVVADLYMPGQGGLDLLRQIRRRSPRTRSILLTGQPDLGSAMEAVNDLGVAAFYTKGCDPQELIAKIHGILQAMDTASPVDVLTQEEKDFFKA